MITDVAADARPAGEKVLSLLVMIWPERRGGPQLRSGLNQLPAEELLPVGVNGDVSPHKHGVAQVIGVVDFDPRNRSSHFGSVASVA
jgi:hypothetical protein